MNQPFGPWATLIATGQSPQLSAFWRRRMGRLAAVSRSSPALSRGRSLFLGAAVIILCLVPTLRLVSAVAEEAAGQARADAGECRAIKAPAAKTSGEKPGEHKGGVVSLEEAVAAFNRELAACRFDVEGMRQPALTKDQIPTPLTVEEVIAAIRNLDRKKHPMADATFAIFLKIAETRMLPPDTRRIELSDQWFVDQADERYEDRVFRIGLCVMTGKNTGHGIGIRELKLGRRIALHLTPGYQWVTGPQPATGPQVWGGHCLFSLGQDQDRALVLVVSRIGETFPDLHVVAFDKDARRYELTGRDSGSHTHASRVALKVQRFRLDPAKLPFDKVWYWGIEENFELERLQEEVAPARPAS